jgi:ribosomal-protein-alanine N-acetyltransferase
MGASQRPSTVLETERLLLRGQSASDLPFLIDLWTDPDVTSYLGGPRKRQRLEADLREGSCEPPAGSHDLWPTVERATGRPVGHCGLLRKEVEGREETDVIYVLARTAWGRGYATEVAQALGGYAFSTLGDQRLIALIDPENLASERVAVKIGMRLERTIPRPGGSVRRLYAVERAAGPAAGRREPA